MFYLAILGKHVNAAKLSVLCKADLHGVGISDFLGNQSYANIIHSNNLFWINFRLKKKRVHVSLLRKFEKILEATVPLSYK